MTGHPGTPLLSGAHSTALGHIPTLRNEPEVSPLSVIPSNPAGSARRQPGPVLQHCGRSPLPRCLLQALFKIQHFLSLHLRSQFPPATQKLQITFTCSTKLLAGLYHTLKKCLQSSLLKIQELTFLPVPEGPKRFSPTMS